MKKVLKWVLLAVLVVVVIAGGFAAYIAMSGMPTYDTQKINLKVEATPERVAHGRDLAMSLCAACHLNQNTGVLSGTQMLDMPEAFGTAYSKNITQHPTKGIGKWTDGDIAWLLRTGIHPHTGSYVPPWMIKLPRMSDEDLYSIIAWLRSDDPLLAPSAADNVPSEPTFLAKMLVHMVFKPYDYPSKPIPQPDTTNTTQYGKYLVTAVYDCYGCHLNDFADQDANDPEKSKGYCAGGNAMKDAAGNTVHSANITPDKATGIGSWSRDEFVQTMKSGITPKGHVMRFPMGRMTKLSDHALGSMYDYLHTIPAISHAVERAAPTGPWKSQGEKLFDKYACSTCHSKTGKGHANLLAANSKYPADSVLYDVIRNPLRYNPDSYMPHFGTTIPDADLAVLAQHVRTLCNK
ncbi:MAG: c-type cytochrome [Bradyrhizobiaceae bacterium]|nr:c-type cytochrome [Bradyrhizobiaceae bacterium]